MSLIGSLVDKLLTKGSITLLRPGKRAKTFGSGGGKHLTVRFTDRKVAFDIIKNPRLGLGEAYMDGRLIIEDGTILDLLEMIVGSPRTVKYRAGRSGVAFLNMTCWTSVVFPAPGAPAIRLNEYSQSPPPSTVSRPGIPVSMLRMT